MRRMVTFYFGDNLPASAMACGATLAAVSMHKSGEMSDAELSSFDRTEGA